MSATAVQTIARLRDVIAGEGPRPIAAALHVGKQAHALISQAAGWVSAHSGRPLPTLYGVPIVVGSVQPPPLDEFGWRLLDGLGGVVAEGTVTP